MVKKKKIVDPFLAREAGKYEKPIASREFILATIKEYGEAISELALAKCLHITDEEQLQALKRRLLAMVRDAQLVARRKKYSLLQDDSLVKGVISIDRDGIYHFTAQTGGESMKLQQNQHRVLPGDVVLAIINYFEDNAKPRASVASIVDKKITTIVGKYIKDNDFDYIIPMRKVLGNNPIVCTKSSVKPKDGDTVLAEINRDGVMPSELSAKVIEVLGNDASAGIEIKEAIYNHEIPTEWSKQVIAYCNKLGNVPRKSDFAGRVDLRQLPLVTIDGEDTRDFDDAVYCEKNKSGGWKLYVAIADVAHYVTPNSDLDKAARLRGNSTYFPGMAVPMLPEQLSNILCSLQPLVDRLCVVCEMNISADGLLTKYKFYRGVMNSHARLTYTEVAAMVEGNTTLRKRYAAIINDIDELHALYLVLKTQRDKRGALEFETVETKVLFNKTGKIERIIPSTRKVSHCIIEEMMLCANVATAKFLKKHKALTLFRNHAGPQDVKLAELRDFLRSFGLILPQHKLITKEYAAILEKAKTMPEFSVIQTVMLRSLSQAVYAPENIGHFGLSYEEYTHFTSPIRRYPDLIIHRAIGDILDGKKHVSPPSEEEQELMELLGAHCSVTERRSDDAAREVMTSLKCKYMLDKIGEEYDGVITGVTNFGLFVELKDLYIDGLVHIRNLGDDYYIFDASKHCLIGEHYGMKYTLGDEIKIRLSSVDTTNKRIDLMLAADNYDWKDDENRKPSTALHKAKKRSSKHSTSGKTAKSNKKSAAKKHKSNEVKSKPGAAKKPSKKRNRRKKNNNAKKKDM